MESTLNEDMVVAVQRAINPENIWDSNGIRSHGLCACVSAAVL